MTDQILSKLKNGSIVRDAHGRTFRKVDTNAWHEIGDDTWAGRSILFPIDILKEGVVD